MTSHPGLLSDSELLQSSCTHRHSAATDVPLTPESAGSERSSHASSDEVFGALTCEHGCASSDISCSDACSEASMDIAEVPLELNAHTPTGLQRGHVLIICTFQCLELQSLAFVGA